MKVVIKREIEVPNSTYCLTCENLNRVNGCYGCTVHEKPLKISQAGKAIKCWECYEALYYAACNGGDA